MRIECERCLIFAAGAMLGACAYAAVKNGKAKQAAVKAMARGIKLQEQAAEAAEKTKESLSDMYAEAKNSLEEAN
ncbi:MAG: DUF1490 family protein [Synergistes sp.]|nr:DUF1490 family protein [Synergistes sp.]